MQDQRFRLYRVREGKSTDGLGSTDVAASDAVNGGGQQDESGQGIFLANRAPTSELTARAGRDYSRAPGALNLIRPAAMRSSSVDCAFSIRSRSSILMS